ncbi:phytoene desaturase family protein [Rudaeicoccus suwonensis]|uniref:Phytoene dehydrogenase-like protein n=1 Tax=Rudaeicoccus suwonensis TaxID=657409 RepID=A0A561E9S8_9MICO|nr:NAD(P)/FAD-dependent oxidoreductase [Rudaeicoccus suwonensis]TWE12373.1 phytoene dehydrogenase-like protein [Rudaeicoccus suwonensis]
MQTKSYDVVIVGGGHNGLTAAAYLARAGKSVLLLERQDHLGGASVSAEAFPGMGARLSRYSYLVSLLPQQIIDDLGLRITLARRRFASYTPVPGGDLGLLVDNGDAAATRASFEAIGAGGDVDGWHGFYARTAHLAHALWPTVTEPLARMSEVSRRIGDDTIVRDFLQRPLGEVIERSVAHDLVRGVILTDGLISTFASAHDADLQQNVCFLYHVIGGGTGAWDVPVGGMGEVSGALLAAATAAGADLRTDAQVTAVADDKITWVSGDDLHTVHAKRVLWAAAPAVLDSLMATSPGAAEGAQVKVNLLLSRLPRLRDAALAPEAAFGGTFHINETYTQLESAYRSAISGQVPTPVPAEIYCHSITDPSILSPALRESGAQTLTVFSLQTPDRLLDGSDAERAKLQQAVLDSLSSVLAEPIEDVVMRGPSGALCIETKTTRDLQDTLAMPGGNIFHGPLSWPFADDEEPLTTPAQRWGVATPYGSILLAGAGSRRGGGVSGLGGYHAARAVLEDA